MTIEKVEQPIVKLDFSDTKAVKDFINNTRSGMYFGKNVEGESIMILLDKEEGFELHTDQSNGWTRINDYNEDGVCEGERWNGRWDK
jgi:hypothetical protein